MSEIGAVSLSEYLKDDIIYLENVNLENCRLLSLRDNGILFRKCVFQSVVIDGNDGKWGDCAEFRECEFRNCIFRGNFGNTFLTWEENFFKNCLFEDINIEYGGDISSIVDNGFFDCKFKSVRLNEDIHFLHLTVSGGRMQDVTLFSTYMIANLFSNIQMEQIKISALYGENIMDSITFRDVTLEWEPEDHNYPDGNLFYQCDTDGLTCYRHAEDGGKYEEN